jgi:DinB superfamily
MPEPEVWLRGPLDGYPPLLMPVAHSLLQVREDLARLERTVRPEQLWARPGGAASIGFHIRHTGGALDRLLTYARGEALSAPQLVFLAGEEAPGDPPVPLSALVIGVNAVIDRSLAQLRAADPGRLVDTREVGRGKLPSTVLGLLVHAAEHSTRHMGQAITTARILSGG